MPLDVKQLFEGETRKLLNRVEVYRCWTGATHWAMACVCVIKGELGSCVRRGGATHAVQCYDEKTWLLLLWDSLSPEMCCTGP